MHIMFTVEQATEAGDTQEWCPEQSALTSPCYIIMQ